ncbi:MAG TPA: DUF2058 domain-containing protein [Gammaproteobacteria bacterium]|nr:DUF2058 domain-containing protein [Gammaproteobacteria bacterium]
MKGSLQEQLLKSGLISEERLNDVKKTAKKNHRKKKRSSPEKPKQPAQPIKPAAPADIKKQKELRADVKKLLRSHKLNDKSGEIAYNYTLNNQVKRFFVTENQQKALINGSLAIANWNGISYLINTEIVKELRALYPKIDICVVEHTNAEVDQNDPYAEYVIPDDMKW